MNPIFEAIADDLASNGYAIADQFLSQQEVNSIRGVKEFQEGLNHFKKAGIGNSQSLQIQESVRGDYIKWLDREQSPAAVKIYLNRLQELIVFLNQSLYLSLKDYEVHMTVYPIGTFYKRHLDQFKKNDHRKLSVICYLNDNWKIEHGGELRMYLENETLDVLPTEGKLVCFRSDLIEHEVLPATRERLSITGWMLDQLVDFR